MRDSLKILVWCLIGYSPLCHPVENEPEFRRVAEIKPSLELTHPLTTLWKNESWKHLYVIELSLLGRRQGQEIPQKKSSYADVAVQSHYYIHKRVIPDVI